MKRILIILSLVFFLLSLGNAQLRVDSLKADVKIYLPVGGLQDSTVTLSDFTTAAYNFVGAGGAVTNNPDDVTLENKGGETIGIKVANNQILVAANDATTGQKGLADYECDGTADEVQIAAALSDLNTAGGGTLELSPGTYNIQAECFNTYDNIEIVGQGRGTTIISVATADVHFGFRNCKNITIRNLTIDGEDVDETEGFALENVENIVVDNITVSHTDNHLLAVHGVRNGKITNSSFIDSTNSGNADHGVDFDLDSAEDGHGNYDVIFANNYVYNYSTEAIKLENSRRITIANNILHSRIAIEDYSGTINPIVCSFISITGNQIIINPDKINYQAVNFSNIAGSEYIVTGNIFDSTKVNCVSLIAGTDSLTNMMISNNIFRGHVGSNVIDLRGYIPYVNVSTNMIITNNAVGIYIDSIGQGNVKINNNTIHATNSPYRAINVENCDYGIVVISNNTCSNVQTGIRVYSSKNVDIINNRVENCSQTGILVQSSDSCMTAGNKIINCQLSGYKEDDGGHHILVSNTIMNCTYGVHWDEPATAEYFWNILYNNGTDIYEPHNATYNDIQFLNNITIEDTLKTDYVKAETNINIADGSVFTGTNMTASAGYSYRIGVNGYFYIDYLDDPTNRYFQFRGGSAGNILMEVNENEEIVIGGGAGMAGTFLSFQGTDKAFCPPRMTTTERDALSPAGGWMIYNTTTNKLQVYNGTSWNDCY